MTPTDTPAEVSPALAHQHANRLGKETSPYLLQHAGNPVDWYPWGEEAFAKARHENKPIFLSIGYSTCHWCHVMAHESFENQAVAAIMNREFVNIKVDREERPDVDRVYMTFVQATTGHGGWPMSVWLTPDLQPFVGGTYFPPEDRYGQPAFTKVLEGIATAWKQNREKISQQGERIVAALRESQGAAAPPTEPVSAGALEQAFTQFSSTFDAEEGGFGTVPKFPRPVALNFLLRFHAHEVAPKPNATGTVASESHRGIGLRPMSDRQDADPTRALEIVLLTLRKMAEGGMHDHLGGGFHRYSVDRFWHVPHFEKMLYDQAQLATVYLDAALVGRASSPEKNHRLDANATSDAATFSSVADDILNYVARDMTSKEGGFYSAEDADSEVAQVSNLRLDKAQVENLRHNKAEGAFYVWTKDEIDSALGHSAEIFSFHYGVEPNGNVPGGSDPQGEFRGKNILIQRHTIAETARHFEKSEEEIADSIARSREKLFSIRAQRPRPHLDDKILASWNGLMISAYARGSAFQSAAGQSRASEAEAAAGRSCLEIATKAARFIRERLWDDKEKLLFRSYRQGKRAVEGFADDYAFVIQGMLDLYEASFDIEWLKFAVQLQATQDRLFLDEKSGGYFSTSGKDKNVVLRMKDDNDSAEPAASSVAALNLLRLAQIKNDSKYQERAEQTINAFRQTLSTFPSAMPQILVALDFSLSKPRQVVIAGKLDAPETKVLLGEVRRHFSPNTIVLLADGGEGQKYLGENNEAIRAMTPVNGKAAAYVCENFTCKAPVTDPQALARLLGSGD